MSREAQFRRGLADLWRRYNSDLHSLVAGGRARGLDRKRRDQAISDLCELGGDMLPRTRAKALVKEWTKEVLQRTYRRSGVRRGPAATFERFFGWAREKIGDRPFVYAFFNRGKCIYVGKAGKSFYRLNGYRDNRRFHHARRMKVFVTTKRHLARLECLQIHLLKPRENVIRRTSSENCIVCKAKRRIDKSLHAALV